MVTTEYTLIEALPVSGPCEVLFTSNTVTIEVSKLELDLAASSNFSGFNISCNGASDGAIEASAQLGVGNYNYVWSNGETTPNIADLPFGKYTVSVTDETGCEGH